ncbi:hypothetical protein [Sulfitobacter sp.]|jgi:hypothetical protein|uniref:hypothetical protein n=1 Tax=Sulfitobacter sp. TaxID=1903071 RepID=UPI0039E69EE2
MANIDLHFSDDEPIPETELVLKIDYSENSGSAARVFEIAADLIHSLEEMDRVFTQSIHIGLETALVVEDLQKSSLKIFLRNVLRGLPDEALKDGDVKKLIGHYLFKAKYAAIRWLDEPENDHRPISDLTEEIAVLARETDMLHLPDYPAPNPARLAQPLDRFQEAKRRFATDENLTITLGRDEYKVDLGSDWLPSETVSELDEIKELVNEQDIYLIIGKPDFIGNAKWAFRHGKRSLSLRIEDEDWLINFRSGKYPIKPGDALRVRLRSEHKYDEKGNLTSTTETIVKVLDVIEGSGETGDLFQA